MEHVEEDISNEEGIDEKEFYRRVQDYIGKDLSFLFIMLLYILKLNK